MWEKVNGLFFARWIFSDKYEGKAILVFASRSEPWSSIVFTLLSAGGVEPPTKFSKGEGGRLDKTLTFRGSSWERGGTFFRGVCNFYIKNKVKSEIFNNKKFINKNIFLLLLKDKIGLKMKNHNILGVHWKIQL